MKITVSLIIAYIISGLAHVGKQIFAAPIDRTAYGRRPTFGMTLFIVFGWPIATLADNIAIARGNVARGVAFGLGGSVIQILGIGVGVWCVISIVSYLFNLIC